MLRLISSYLTQNKSATLPFIGSFQTRNNAAKIDMINKVILPPQEEIVFTQQEEKTSRGLVSHLASSKGISANEAEEQLKIFCKNVSLDLNAGERYLIDAFGSLQQSDTGQLLFVPLESYKYLRPIPAARVIRENQPHQVLVGDKETTSSVMTDYFSAPLPIPKDRWVLYSILLTVICIIALIYYYSHHSFDSVGVGNRALLH